MSFPGWLAGDPVPPREAPRTRSGREGLVGTPLRSCDGSAAIGEPEPAGVRTVSGRTTWPFRQGSFGPPPSRLARRPSGLWSPSSASPLRIMIERCPRDGCQPAAGPPWRSTVDPYPSHPASAEP